MQLSDLHFHLHTHTTQMYDKYRTHTSEVLMSQASKHIRTLVASSFLFLAFVFVCAFVFVLMGAFLSLSLSLPPFVCLSVCLVTAVCLSHSPSLTFHRHTCLASK